MQGSSTLSRDSPGQYRLTREVADLYTRIWLQVSKGRGILLPARECDAIVALLPFPLGPSREGLPPAGMESEARARARAVLERLMLTLDSEGRVHFHGLLQVRLAGVGGMRLHRFHPPSSAPRLLDSGRHSSRPPPTDRRWAPSQRLSASAAGSPAAGLQSVEAARHSRLGRPLRGPPRRCPTIWRLPL